MCVSRFKIVFLFFVVKKIHHSGLILISIISGNKNQYVVFTFHLLITIVCVKIKVHKMENVIPWLQLKRKKNKKKKVKRRTGWTHDEKNSGPWLNSITGRRAYLCALTFHSLVRLVDPQIWIHSFDHSFALWSINHDSVLTNHHNNYW